MAQFLLIISILILVTLVAWRLMDKRADQVTWSGLAARQPPVPPEFDPSMVESVPEPAQRFFKFAIRPGTALYTVAEIVMAGEFSLRSKAKPNYMPMRGQQILAAPFGFVWKLSAGNMISMAGSDAAENGKSWSRFWLFGIVPVARVGNNDDHASSAFGRYIAEAVFWTPAALLPADNVRWSPIDDTTSRVTVSYLGLEQAVDVTVDEEGKPEKVVFQRWSNANPSKTYQLQPFGGYLSEFRNFGGFRLPTRIEAGNHFGTHEYFPFYKVTVSSIRFPQG